MTNRRHAVAFNALTCALADADRHVPLSVREQATTAILEAIDENTQPEPATLTARLVSPVPACPSGRHASHPWFNCEEQDEFAAAWDAHVTENLRAYLRATPISDVPAALRGPNCPTENTR